ncbi:hypothetical protein [Actinomyces sp. MRS3W]|uniref:hypothetical protein n=1 Tax=Actinomyces sp. MRS3W TaxID=2800796 RepID=UPI0028FD8882|nr:hypothetical protein [Actinomyces sp. MRS3W]MDU0348286.1 hypothetical protein [Actinomyces sp. MRS3W]
MTLAGAMWVVGQATSNLIAGRLVDAMGSRGAFLTIVAFAASALSIGLVAMTPIRRATTGQRIPPEVLRGSADPA